MARVLTRETIATLDDKILRKNGVTREQLMEDLIDFKIVVNGSDVGTIHWYKLPFLTRTKNWIREYKLTKTDIGITITAIGLVGAITMGTSYMMINAVSYEQSKTEKISLEQLMSMGDYDACNSFVLNAMLRLDDLIQKTEGVQQQYYLEMQNEMETLRSEVTRTYHAYEEAQSLGIDASQILEAYKSAFQDFVDKAETVGIYYIPANQTLANEGPKLG